MSVATGPLPQGWLSDAEAACLAELAKDRLCLEIGSWLGRSTIAMASVARLVVAVDHHAGPPIRAEGTTLHEFLQNLQVANVRHRVVPILAGFEAAAGLLRPASFGLVFVDGAHDYISVKRDALLAWPLLESGGVLAFHDYGVDPGVYQAVHELSEAWGKPMRREAQSLALVMR